MITAHYYLILSILITGMLLSVWFKKLTLTAAVTGGVCGILVYTGGGYTGVGIMAVFFMMGTLATSWKHIEKKSLATAEDDSGRRKAGQVLANAGVAATVGALSLFLPAYTGLWCLLIAACFSAALADTLASELGTVYGKQFYNILTLKPDQRGLDGVISLEGTLVGLAGSVTIATLYGMVYWVAGHFVIIVLAGTIGNLTDSVLGAALERKNIMKNDAVNFLNTLTAALFAAVLYGLTYSF